MKQLLEMTDNRNYVFFFPYHGVGGVPVLFLRLADFISEKFDVITYVVDYPDGYMATNPRHKNVKLIEYDQGKNSLIPENSILILQSDLPWGLPKNLTVSQNTTVFFWNCYPFNLIPVFPGKVKEWTSSSLLITKLIVNSLLFPSRLKVVQFLKQTLANQALVFMDGPNYFATKYCLGTKIESPVFLPILIKNPSNVSLKPTNKDNNANSIRACWLGRIADFKIYSLLRVADDLKEAAAKQNIKIQLTIIGSGDREHILKEIISTSEFFTYELIPNVATHQLDQFLAEKVDVLFAMGTSALEGAKIALPTVSVDFSYRPILAGYKYRFIYEAENYSLGDIISENIKNEHSMSDILTIYKQSSSEIADKCYRYFLAHHDLEKQIDLFLNLSQKSSLLFKDIISKRYTAKPWFYNLWKWIKLFRNIVTK